MSSLPARILDDYMVCRTRAYYTAHPELFKPRRIPDMEDSEKRGRVFISRYLIPSMLRASREIPSHRVMKIEDCNEEDKTYHLSYEGLDREIACRPDLVSILLLRGGYLRALVFEAGETDVDTVLRRRHVMPRLLLYMLAVSLYYGIPPVGFYISLSPRSSIPVIAVALKTGQAALTHVLEEISKLISAPDIPKPKGNPVCSHCVYATICKYAV